MIALKDTTHTSPNPYHNVAPYQGVGQQHDFTALYSLKKAHSAYHFSYEIPFFTATSDPLLTSYGSPSTFFTKTAQEP
jgi:hypothetical protein